MKHQTAANVLLTASTALSQMKLQADWTNHIRRLLEFAADIGGLNDAHGQLVNDPGVRESDRARADVESHQSAKSPHLTQPENLG